MTYLESTVRNWKMCSLWNSNYKLCENKHKQVPQRAQHLNMTNYAKMYRVHNQKANTYPLSLCFEVPLYFKRLWVPFRQVKFIFDITMPPTVSHGEQCLHHCSRMTLWSLFLFIRPLTLDSSLSVIMILLSSIFRFFAIYLMTMLLWLLEL